MSRRTKILNKVKTIFGRESSRAGHPPENSVLVETPNRTHAGVRQPDLLIAPGPLPGGGTHNSRPESLREENRGGTSAGDERPEAEEGKNNGATPAPVPSDGERIIGETEHTVPNDILGALDHKHQSTSGQEPCNWQDVGDVDSSERVPEIRVINPSSSDHLDRRAGVHRAAAGNNQDGELDVPSGPPNPMGHSLSESMKLDNIKHSGISIGGGPVNVNNISFSGSERIRRLKLLLKRVATSAFHNSARRVDPPRCHENTRVAIQQQIYDWIVLDLLVRQTWIMWMHGAAGAGKSAIVQSIAELCEQAQIPLASFFFIRTDATRNSMAPLIVTLVYQLIQSIPQVQEEILGIIENHPLIFDQSLKSQLEKLIIQPLLRVREHFKGFFVILIDGLDECIERAHQVDLIKLLGTISRSRMIPVVFLVASRREPQIEAAFARKEVSDSVRTIPLDNSDIEQTSDDIRRYLVDKFCDIKETHLRKHHLPIDWPPASSIKEIVSKSSGQFIFASVVINYLSSPRANPAHQLEVIRGIRLRDPHSQNPFAHLDALYEYIFSQVEALGEVLHIIAYAILPEGKSDINYIQRAFLLDPGELDVLFADLTAVILCEPPTQRNTHKLIFLHASLPDFLVDKTRSAQYHIDLDEYRANLLCRFIERRPPILDENLEAAIDRERSRLYAIENLLKKAKATEQLRRAFMNFNCTFYSKTFFEDYWYTLGPNILSPLQQLDFSDQCEAYHHVIDIFAAEYAKYYWTSLADDVKEDVERESPDLVARIEQILEQVN
ncbi:hypothetical protein BJ912DRAFT_925382 [Pholiota molesta]|nr:hypothetical protein BJ912DRAFT_925382 [Pholiota molesta]